MLLNASCIKNAFHHLTFKVWHLAFTIPQRGETNKYFLKKINILEVYFTVIMQYLRPMPWCVFASYIPSKLLVPFLAVSI